MVIIYTSDAIIVNMEMETVNITIGSNEYRLILIIASPLKCGLLAT